MAELNYFLGILTLKFEEISTFLMIKDNFSAFVTGAVIPLALLPEWIIEGMRFCLSIMSHIFQVCCLSGNARRKQSQAYLF